MKRATALISCLLLMPSAFAENLPTLNEAIGRALTYSPEIAMAEARVSYAEDRVRAAHWGWFHPEVHVYAGESVVTGTNRAGIQVSQDVMRLITLNGDEVHKAQHDLLVAQQELSLTKDKLTQQVSDTRLRLQRLEQTVRFQMQLVAHHDALVILAKTQFEQGSIPFAQILAAQDVLIQSQQTLSQTQAELHNTWMTWAQLIGEPLPADI